MVRRAIEVAVTDALLLVGTYLVILNREWKVNCVLGKATDCTPRSSPHFSYSVFTLYFSLNSSLTPHVLLASPPSLDWVQVLAAALIVLNAWYFYGVFKGIKKRRAHAVAAAQTKGEPPLP